MLTHPSQEAVLGQGHSGSEAHIGWCLGAPPTGDTAMWGTRMGC